MNFEEAVYIALNAEFKFKAAYYEMQYQNASKAEPMDFIHDEDEAEIQAAKHLSSSLTSVDVTCAEAQNTFVLTVRCESNVSLGRTKPLPQAATLARQGKTSIPSRCGATYWEGNKLLKIL